MPGRDYDDDDFTPDAWDEGSRDAREDDLDDLQDALHSGFGPRDLEGAADDERDIETEPREFPREGPTRDAPMAKLAMSEIREALSTVPRGRAPEIRALPERRRRAGMCCVIVICTDGRKAIFR